MDIKKQVCVTVLIFFISLTGAAAAPEDQAADSLPEMQIEKFIKTQMKKGKIPGVSVVVVKENDTIYQKGFGFADLKSKTPVAPGTLFELGSNSKAFTALGILLLEDKKLLNLKDPVNKYIPWFKMEYKGAQIDITLEQLMYHTSGIPYNTLGDIPVTEEDGALEKTVRGVCNNALEFYPGSSYLYTSMNYDVLGLVIQVISGQLFENYMKDNILTPLGMTHTYLLRKEAISGELALGYKIGFLRPHEFTAPVYRGNTPAGYFISDSIDMARWLKIQLGTEHIPASYQALIERSHIPNRRVPPRGDGSSYAKGWNVYQTGGGKLSHGGNNPNYSSFIIFRPEEKLGVAVMANMNSMYVHSIGQGIMNILLGNTTRGKTSDLYADVDNMAFMVICILIPLSALTVFFLLSSIVQIFKRSRKFTWKGIKVVAGLLVSMAFISGIGYCLYNMNNILFEKLPWSFISVWAPVSLFVALFGLFGYILIFYLYTLITVFFPKPNEKSIFSLIILSVASGLGNALIIFIVNIAVSSNVQNNLIVYFVMGIILYVFGQRLIRAKLVKITNRMVFTKRVELFDRILKSSFEKLEKLQDGKIHAGLNNDTETVSNFANIVISGATNLITLICCFIYLGIMSVSGLIISMAVILVLTALYAFVGFKSEKIWQQTRSIQNVFFKFINDIISGFKELSVNEKKRSEFRQDMEESCDTYTKKRIEGQMKFTNVFVIGELLFTFVIGAVAFIFPLFLKDMQIGTLRSYIFVFLYMSGPIHSILNTIPNLIQMRISWKRINALIEEVSLIEMEQTDIERLDFSGNLLNICLKDMIYHYTNKNGESFAVGPINYEFNSGEIIFVTGGNGSGKSTLAKLISGLYTPSSGEILINGQAASPGELGRFYSAIFSDYHLFDKLYGIDHKSKKEEIIKYLHTLRINDKLTIEEGMFSSLKLSSGQRKRLALLISYLEDRPVFLFDEWAADQDPEFRKFFYKSLLPELKDKGKCVIAITHDDRYFDVADRVVKMEMGEIVQKSVKADAVPVTVRA